MWNGNCLAIAPIFFLAGLTVLQSADPITPVAESTVKTITTDATNLLNETDDRTTDATVKEITDGTSNLPKGTTDATVKKITDATSNLPKGTTAATIKEITTGAANLPNESADRTTEAVVKEITTTSTLENTLLNQLCKLTPTNFTANKIRNLLSSFRSSKLWNKVPTNIQNQLIQVINGNATTTNLQTLYQSLKYLLCVDPAETTEPTVKEITDAISNLPSKTSKGTTAATVKKITDATVKKITDATSNLPSKTSKGTTAATVKEITTDTTNLPNETADRTTEFTIKEITTTSTLENTLNQLCKSTPTNLTANKIRNLLSSFRSSKLWNKVPTNLQNQLIQVINGNATTTNLQTLYQSLKSLLCVDPAETINCTLCQKSLSCTPSSGCQCVEGYTGTYCHIDNYTCPIPDKCAPFGKCIRNVEQTCKCLAGWTGKTCEEDINECKTRSHNCSRNAICINTKGAFICLCREGYIGNGFNCIEDPIVTFDCTRFHSDNLDAPSQVTYLDFPFSIGEETFTSFRVSPNGYLIGGSHYSWYYYLMGPLRNFQYPIVAGLFGDFDLRTGEKVCYDVIYKGSTTKAHLKLQNKVDDIVKNYTSGNYTSDMIILVHWKNVPRYPAYSYGSGRNIQTANFQVFISTNGKNTYAIFNHGKNSWNKDSYIFRYFTAGYTSGTGDSKVLEGSGTDRSNDFTNQMGNTGIKGRNIFHMSQYEPPQAKCERWIKDATTYPPTILTCSMCPPTIQQAFIERHWLWFDSTSKCKNISSSVYTFMVNFRTRGSYDYNPGYWTHGICTYKVAIEGNNLKDIFCADSVNNHWYRWHSMFYLKNYLNSNQASKTCGELITDLPYAGTLQSPTSNWWWWWGQDRNERYGRKVCVDKAKMYTQFSKVRPVCNSDRYNDFKDVMERFRGDPHLTTLDGVDWTFNGLGEYIMVRSSSSASVRGLEVQARLERASSAVPNVTSRATVFTGFAARMNGSDIVQTLYNRSASDIDIYIDNKWTTSMRSLLNEDTNFNFTGGFIETSGNNTVSVSFDQGISLNVEKTLNFIQLTFLIQSTLKNQLEGLMGNFNDNKLDDFITPTGSVMASNSSERELYRYGLTWRITNQSESLFTYKPGESVSTFFDPNFEPVYVEDFQDPLKLLGLFSNNSALLSKANETCHHPERSVYLSCMYDTAQLQTVDAAISAIQTNEKFESVKKVLDNTPPYIEMPNSLNLTIGDVVKLPIQVSDKENDTIILEYSETESSNKSFIIAIDSRNKSIAQAITLNVTDYTKFRPTITAKDSKGAVSLYRPTIYLCHCLNGGKCDFAYLSSSLANGNADGVYLAQCQCPGRYSGDRCEVHPCDTLPSPCYDKAGCRYDNETITCRPCPAGMDGDGTKCYDRDECILTPSPCEDVCINTNGSYLCQCNKPGYRVSSTNSSRCEDIDECASNTMHNCKSDEICRNKAGWYDCLCRTGYQKDVFGICDNVNECNEADTCGPNTECIDTVGSYMCPCKLGFTRNSYGWCSNPGGSTCDPNPCKFGKCKYQDEREPCSCYKSYTGQFCELEIQRYQCETKLYRRGSGGEIEETWTADYEDDSGLLYMQTSKAVCSHLTSSLKLSGYFKSNEEKYLNCTFTKFKQGSVMSLALIEFPAMASLDSSAKVAAALNTGYQKHHQTQGSVDKFSFGSPNSGVIVVTDVDECSTGQHNCHWTGSCTNTDGSYTCSCRNFFTYDNDPSYKGRDCRLSNNSWIILGCCLLILCIIVIGIVIKCSEGRKGRNNPSIYPEDPTYDGKQF